MPFEYSTLEHCKTTANTRVYWLPSQDTRYMVQVFLTGACPLCRKALNGWYGIQFNGKRGHFRSLKPREFAEWHLRLKDAIAIEQNHAGPQVSDYTRLISSDTASVHSQVIQRTTHNTSP